MLGVDTGPSVWYTMGMDGSEKNGTNDEFSSQRPMGAKCAGEGIGPAAAVAPLRSSTSDPSATDKEIDGFGITDKWGPIIEHQIAEDWPDLEAKDRAFCDKYLECYNHGDAAEEIGRPRSAGPAIYGKDLNTAYIKWRQDERYQESAIDDIFFQHHYLHVIDAAAGKVEVPCVTGSGEAFEAKKFNGDLLLKALDKLAVMNGIAEPEDKKKSGPAVQVIIDVGALIGKKELPVVSEQ